MSKAWWRAAGIRALKTMAQTLLALLASTGLASLTPTVDVTKVNWLGFLVVTVAAGVFSLLTSLKGLPEVPDPNGTDITAVNSANRLTD